jgi:hypothetical protein
MMTESSITRWADIFPDHEGQGLSSAGTAIQIWAFCQCRTVTVREAMAAFRVSEEMIVEAVEEHYWMFLEGNGPDATIEHEGE